MQAFRARLELRYPLCPACAAAVARVLAEQERTHQATWLGTVLKTSLAPAPPAVRSPALLPSCTLCVCV
jgi:hypothetical protein